MTRKIVLNGNIMRFQAMYYLYLFLCCTHLSAAEILHNFQGRWIGVEVMGGDQETAKLIRSNIPIHKGDQFSSTHSNKYKKWCDEIRSKFENNEIDCSFIGYDGGNFYYNIQLKSKDKIYSFRDIPKSIKNNIKIDNELLNLYNNFDKLFWSYVSKGTFPQENFDKGYLDFDVPELHAFIKPLSKLAKANSQRLLDIIEYSYEPELRAKAGRLLSWSQSPDVIQHIIDRDLLNDPDKSVRNDLTRSISLYLERINDEVLLEKGVRAFCRQAALPSHTDRNKALYSLNTIFNKNSKAASVVDQSCILTLNEIAQISILPNVGGIAKDILKNLDKAEYEKNINFSRQGRCSCSTGIKSVKYEGSSSYPMESSGVFVKSENKFIS